MSERFCCVVSKNLKLCSLVTKPLVCWLIKFMFQPFMIEKVEVSLGLHMMPFMLLQLVLHL